MEHLSAGAQALFWPQVLSGCQSEALSAKSIPDPTNPQLGTLPPDFKVVIVGAGISGLYAGLLLKQKGIPFSIVEASSRLGGRIRSLKGFADYGIELGAEEIHGKNTLWYSLVKGTQAEFVDDETDDFLFAKKQLKSVSGWESDTNYQQAVAFIEQANSYKGADQTVAQLAQLRGISADFAPLVNAQLGNEYGTSNTRLSIKGISEEDDLWTAGNQNYMLRNKTFDWVLEQHFSSITDQIQYQTAVKSIQYQGSKILLTTLQGQIMEADRVIVTVPLVILKNQISFEPSLPSTKQAAMKAIGMDSGMKIILKFSQRFWPSNLGSLYGSLVPEYWFTSFGRGNVAVLTAFVMGEKAEYLSKLGSQATNTVLTELDTIFGNQIASKSFTGSVIQDWGKETYIGGAYSYPMVGGGIQMRKDLAASVQNRLFFAGEATHFAGHSGTVHGALETGQRAVNELIKTL